MGLGSERVSKSSAQRMGKEAAAAASGTKDQKALQFDAIARQRWQTCAMAINVGCRSCGAVGDGGAPKGLEKLEWSVS